jgi:hypothetical protein
MTTAGYIGKTTNSNTDVVGAHADRRVDEQWGPIDGEIVNYDAAKGTATVKPLYKPLFNGEATDMPTLYEVPLEQARSASSGLTFPIPPGSKVRLTPQMRSGENYHTDNDGAPSDQRSFHLADMVATLTGGDSLTAPLQNVDADNVHLRPDAAGQYGLKASPDGKASLTGAQGEWLDLLTQDVEKTAQGFTLLGTEPSLVHTSEYADIGAALTVVAARLRAMVLT